MRVPSSQKSLNGIDERPIFQQKKHTNARIFVQIARKHDHNPFSNWKKIPFKIFIQIFSPLSFPHLIAQFDLGNFQQLAKFCLFYPVENRYVDVELIQPLVNCQPRFRWKNESNQ